MKSRATRLTSNPPLRTPWPAGAAVANRLFTACLVLVGGFAIGDNLLPAAAAVSQAVPATLFGACLACFLSDKIHRHHECIPSTDELRSRLRQASRIVYLALYLLLGANAVVMLLCHRPMQPAAQNLGWFVVAGVAVLALLRAQCLGRHYAARHQRRLCRWLVPCPA
jgi:hypothetical protein